MQNIHRPLAFWFLALSFVVLANVSQSYAQLSTLISPSKVSLNGVSIVDTNHAMIVGDSATVLIMRDTTVRGFLYFDLAPVPVSANIIFYGVSYYDTLHAIVVGSLGTIVTTSDKGKTWTQQGNGLTSNSLRAVTHISGSNFQIVGDAGTILRSVDYGATWTQITSGTTKTLYGVAFGSANVGLIAGEKGTMLKTIDGGLTWSPQPQAGIPSRNFYSVAMLDELNATAVGDSALIRRTSDGSNWHTEKDSNLFNKSQSEIETARNFKLTSVTYTGLASMETHANPGKNGVGSAIIAGGDGDVFYAFFNREYFVTKVKAPHDTTWAEFDTTWIPATIGRNGDADGGNDAEHFRLNAVTFYKSNGHVLSIFAGPHGEIFFGNDSTIDGWSWGFSKLQPSRSNYLFASFDENGYGYATETGSHVLRTSDNGYSWKEVSPGNDVSGVYCADSNMAVVAGWGGALLRTTDGGVKWDSIPSASQYSLHGFAFTSKTTGFCIGDGGTILRTTDGGKSWQDKSSSFPSFLKEIAFSNSDTGVAVGDGGSMINTTDGGNTWTYNGNQPLADPNANLRYIQSFPNGIYYVGADSGIMKSTDYGQTWQVIYQPPDSVGTSFYNAKIGIVGLYSTSSRLVPDTMILKSTTDGGATWSKAFSVPIYNIHRMIAHWLDDHTFLLYGLDGFIVKVDLQGHQVVSEIISPGSSIRAYPNPSSQKNIIVEYQTEKDGEVTIELWDEAGKKIETLYSGFEEIGMHQRILPFDQNLHGTFFIRTKVGGKMQTLRIVKL